MLMKTVAELKLDAQSFLSKNLTPSIKLKAARGEVTRSWQKSEMFGLGRNEFEIFEIKQKSYEIQLKSTSGSRAKVAHACLRESICYIPVLVSIKLALSSSGILSSTHCLHISLATCNGMRE